MSRVYLSGPISGLTYEGCTDWREGVAGVLLEHGIEPLSPLRGKGFLKGRGIIEAHEGQDYANPLTTDRGITTRDRFDTQRCDFMLVNLLDASRVSIGTMIELGWADAARVPIVLVMAPENIHNHAIVRGVAGYITDELDEGVDIILTALARKAA